MGLEQPAQSDIHGGFFRQGETPSGKDGQASAAEISDGEHQAGFGADSAAGGVPDAKPCAVGPFPIYGFGRVAEAGPDACDPMEAIENSAGDGVCGRICNNVRYTN